jgi:hypothetical protein
MKICKKCKNKYPANIVYFPRRKRYKDNLSSWCRKCERKQALKHYYAHHSECIKRTNNWRGTIRGHLISIFGGIKQRCEDINNKHFKNYGGRGIRLLFKNSREFADYVVNELKIDPRSLDCDRIDNNGNYEKGNIRFVTRHENLKNRRKF